jgi:hypothetical protein
MRWETLLASVAGKVDRELQDKISAGITPNPNDAWMLPRDGPIRCRERLGGLLKFYYREAG